MLKPAGKLNERELEPQFQATLRGLVARVPFLKLASLKQDVKLCKDPIGRPDWLAELRTGDQSWTLVAEGKKSGQPREVRAAVLQLKHYLSLLPPDKPSHGLVLAPFISEESARICAEAGVGYADFVGNARLSFDRIFIETRAAGSPPSVKREARSIFSPKATRVLRVLLQGPLRAWKVKELAAAADVSLGHVSAVRQQLLAREWATGDQEGIRIKGAAGAQAILRDWLREDDFSHRVQVREYSTLTSDFTLADNLVSFCGAHNSLSDKDPLFTLNFGAWLRAPHNVPTVVSAYFDQFPDERELLPFLNARPVSRGAGNLRILVPNDYLSVEIGQQHVKGHPGFTVVSDLQLVLDLHGGEPNGEEQAAVLRERHDFNGGWA